MSRPRLMLATADERAAYLEQRPRPVYPLHGFITIDGHRCAVEDLRGSWSRPDPLWEVIAPPRHIFGPELTHTLLGLTLADAIDRAWCAGLTPCDGSSGCGCAVGDG